MFEGNPGIQKIIDTWHDGKEGRAAVIVVAALCVMSSIGLVLLISALT